MLRRRACLLFIFTSLLFSLELSAAATLTLVEAQPNKVKLKLGGISNACVTYPSTFVYYKINNYQSSWTIDWMYNAVNDMTAEISLSMIQPSSSISISFQVRYMGWFWGTCNCDYSEFPVFTYNLPAYQPVSNVQASDSAYSDKVVLSWTLNEFTFDNQSYNIYFEGTKITNVPAGTTSFTHTGLAAGSKGTYTVRALVNGKELDAPAGNQGSTFNPALKASSDVKNKVVLTWTNFSNLSNTSGYLIERSDGTLNSLIYDSPYNSYTSYEDVSSTLIPGYLYTYTFKIKPYAQTGISGTAKGKVRPNGKISGTVHTPVTVNNPGGVGVPGIKVVARLKGTALPTDTTTVYSAITDVNGSFTISDIYYYEEAVFTVMPVAEGRTFDPTEKEVTLNIESHNATTDFTDESSFLLSGTVLQGSCPMPEVGFLLNGKGVSGVNSDENGRFNFTVTSGGKYTIRPVLEGHYFSPDSLSLDVSGNTDGIIFDDTTRYVVAGQVSASCGVYIGDATLRFYTPGEPACFSTTVSTGAGGMYTLKLPARKYYVEMLSFTSVDEDLLSSIEGKAYFSKNDSIDLTVYDPEVFSHDTLTKDFVYRKAPTLLVAGLDRYMTCSDEIMPVIPQHGEYVVEFDPVESFNGSHCPAGDGRIIIMENISSSGTGFVTDTIDYMQGEAVTYTFTGGSPNIVAPYKKSFQAILYRDNQTDTVYTDALVVGNRARSQTFTTTTPQIPFQILHNPPGDCSYSYLEKNTSVATSFYASIQQEASVSSYLRAQMGQSLSVGVSVGIDVSVDVSTQFDVTGTFGAGVSGLTTDQLTFTTTTTDRFQTAGGGSITGSGGDLYVGGALNMLYAVSDVLQYDFDHCRAETSKTLVMEPKGLVTTFMYTENHVKEVIIPELESISAYYASKNVTDSAEYFSNQMDVWKQVVEQNRRNIEDATYVTNKTFSGGISYENSVESTTNNNFSIDLSLYIEAGVATDIGASVGGQGIYGGVAVNSRTTIGGGFGLEHTWTNTVGYVLSDDDIGDSYTVNILNDNVYGVPAFRLVAGRTSCPWDTATLHRDGVQLLANTNSQTVKETDPAVFVLQLSNTSESDETRTYDLVFDQVSNPDGAVITIGGSPVVGGIPYPYTIEAGKSVNVTVTVRKGPLVSVYNGLKFTLKSDCDDQLSDDVYLNAVFYKEYTLTLAVSGSGTTTPTAGAHTYPEGKSVILYASPSQGYVFDKWMVGATKYTSDAIMVSMSSDLTATAYFVPTAATQYTLTVTTHGNGSTTPPAGTHYINAYSRVSLTALPDMNNIFVKWLVDGREITVPDTSIEISGNTVIEAWFAPSHQVVVAVAEGEGTVYPAPGIHSVAENSVIHLYASPAKGFVFDHWDISSVIYTTPDVDLPVTADVTASAYFTATSATQYTVTIENGEGGETNPPAGEVYVVDGAELTLTAYPHTGKVFDHWEVDGTSQNTNPLLITVSGDMTVKALFADEPSGIGEELMPVISLFPNPTSGMLTVRSDRQIDRIIITDLSGRMLYNLQKLNTRECTLHLENLPAGVYILTAGTEKQLSQFRFTVLP